MRDTSELFWEAQNLLRGDREQARLRLRAEAERGDEDAKFQLAVILLEWEPEEAIRLWLELEASGVDDAAYFLGGLNFDSDPEAAKYWYRRAISRGSTTAASNLGRLLYNEKSPEAVQWLERAYEAGEEGVAFWLAASLASTDPERALGLYRQAAEEGEAKAYYEVGWLMHRKGDKDSARKTYQQGADRGDKRCLLALFDSWGDDNLLEAQKWLLRWVRSGGLREHLTRRWKRRRRFRDPMHP